LGGVCVCVMSLAALRVRFPVSSGGLVMSLYDTHAAETLGCNWYIALSGGFTTRDATDTLPYLGGGADNSGRNWYAFLTAGRNSYVPTITAFTIVLYLNRRRAYLCSCNALRMCSGHKPFTSRLGCRISWLKTSVFLSACPDNSHNNALKQDTNIFEILPQSQTNLPIPVAARVQGMGLWPFACWHCRFESHRGHGCLSLVSVVCCQVEVSASGWSLLQRSPTKCGVSKCDREASIMRRPWPSRGCCAMGK
jgi:hypothetical protein